MGFFGLFKKKSNAPEQPPPWLQPTPGVSDANNFGFTDPLRPLQPLEQLRPPTTDNPGSISQAEIHTIAAKLDLIATKLDLLHQRLTQLEQSLQNNNPQALAQQRVVTFPQQPSTYRQW